MMQSMLPIWLLPFWILGVPLLWAIVELVRLPASSQRHLNEQPLVRTTA